LDKDAGNQVVHVGDTWNIYDAAKDVAKENNEHDGLENHEDDGHGNSNDREQVSSSNRQYVADGPTKRRVR
jgi:hypothetical protein